MWNNNLALVQVWVTYPNLPKILNNLFFGMVKTIYSTTKVQVLLSEHSRWFREKVVKVMIIMVLIIIQILEKIKTGSLNFRCLIWTMNKRIFLNRNWISCQTREKKTLFGWKATNNTVRRNSSHLTSEKQKWKWWQTYLNLYS